MVISLVNQKGGVGKTTVAINLACGLALRDFSVLLTDCDPQGSVLQWHSIQNHTFLSVERLVQQFDGQSFRKRSSKYDYVVVDAPPAMGDITVSVLDAADLVLIPVGPSALDLWSSRLRPNSRFNDSAVLRHLDRGRKLCYRLSRCSSALSPGSFSIAI